MRTWPSLAVASSSAEFRFIRPPSSRVRGHCSTMCNIVWGWPQLQSGGVTGRNQVDELLGQPPASCSRCHQHKWICMILMVGTEPCGRPLLCCLHGLTWPLICTRNDLPHRRVFTASTTHLGCCLDSVTNRPLCHTVSYAAVRSRNTTPVLRFIGSRSRCW